MTLSKKRSARDTGKESIRKGLLPRKKTYRVKAILKREQSGYCELDKESKGQDGRTKQGGMESSKRGKKVGSKRKDFLNAYLLGPTGRTQEQKYPESKGKKTATRKT